MDRNVTNGVTRVTRNNDEINSSPIRNNDEQYTGGDTPQNSNNTVKFIVLLVLSGVEIFMCCPSCFTSLCGIIALVCIILGNSAYKSGDMDKCNSFNFTAVVLLIVGAVMLGISLLVKFIFGKTISFAYDSIKKLIGTI